MEVQGEGEEELYMYASTFVAVDGERSSNLSMHTKETSQKVKQIFARVLKSFRTYKKTKSNRCMQTEKKYHLCMEEIKM